MRSSVLLAILLCSSLLANASFLPFFEGIRTVITDRQTAISNAAPFDAGEKKELNALKTALRKVDKPSTSLKADLARLAQVISGINKGASNETFAFAFRHAISNYVEVLQATNQTLAERLADADNNPALKQKASALLSEAEASMAAIDLETNVGRAATAAGVTWRKYLTATKAVIAAAKARSVPLPSPKAGQLLLRHDGQVYLFTAIFPLRNVDAVEIVGSGSEPGSWMSLIVHVGAEAGPGTYRYSLTFQTSSGGPVISVSGEDAQVLTATATALAGTIQGTSTGGETVKARFNSKRLFPGLP